MKTFIAFALAFSLFCVVGCGDAGPAKTELSGKVTLPDGSPLPGGRVDFHSSDKGMSSGVIKGDGTYIAPEIQPGEYKVSIDNKSLKGIQPGPTAMPGSDQKYVPLNPKFTKPETSGKSVTVKGAKQTFDIELK